MSLIRTISAPTFGDLKVYRTSKGKLPGQVEIFLPHENEKVKPFETELSKKLQAEGIMTETQEAKTLQKWWDARKTVDARAFGLSPHDINLAITDVLNLDDFLIRSRLVLNAVKDGKTFALEIHSMNVMDDGDIYTEGGKLLKGTRIVVMDFVESIGVVAESFHEDVAALSRAISRLLDFDFEEGKRELASLKRALRPHGRVAKSVELPSTWRYHESHEIDPGMHRRYYEYLLPNGGPAPGLLITNEKAQKSVSSFEDCYCTCVRTPVEFGDREISAVSSILVMPEKRVGVSKAETPF